MDRNAAASGLRLLCEALEDREREIGEYPTSHEEVSDDEADAESPVFDSFYSAGGSEGIMKMTNFTPSEFRSIWNTIEGYVSEHWNVGRGRKSSHSAMDVFFMMLTVLKHGGAWDLMARIFGIKGPTFEKLVMGYIKMLENHLYTMFVKKADHMYNMSTLRSNKAQFKYFPYALEAIDVTFQEANRPSGNMQEGKKYFSGKHKLYGFKTEVTVRPNGIAVACS